jgi:hypothetical protein
MYATLSLKEKLPGLLIQKELVHTETIPERGLTVVFFHRV